jgi:hypothetical protein
MAASIRWLRTDLIPVFLPSGQNQAPTAVDGRTFLVQNESLRTMQQQNPFIYNHSGENDHASASRSPSAQIAR